MLKPLLTVLSACETGLGEVHIGEGVFGLRRAFVLAGAQTLVMSLWKVPDEQTKELMVDFYKGLLSGKGRADALREALKKNHDCVFNFQAIVINLNSSPSSGGQPIPFSSILSLVPFFILDFIWDILRFFFMQMF